MEKPKFSLTKYKDSKTVELVNKTNHTTLAIWAIECSERVMHFFEDSYPNDPRPRQALVTLLHWIETGDFSMHVIRKASLDSHAAAKDIGNENPAASVAHSAGQAVATAHVPLHALGAANYALQAIHRAAKPEDVAQAVLKEREWQLQHLHELYNNLK